MVREFGQTPSSASDIAACERMRDTARRTGKVLEIGYQRTYNAMYHAAYEGIVKSGALGDIYHVRLAWHRNGNWRRKGEPPSGVPTSRRRFRRLAQRGVARFRLRLRLPLSLQLTSCTSASSPSGKIWTCVYLASVFSR